MSGQDPEGYVQCCQLSIPGKGPWVVKSLPRWQTLRELRTLQPGTHFLATAPQPVGAHLTGESSFRRMFSSCVLTDQRFCFRKPWRERFLRCSRQYSAQHGCLWSFTSRAPKVTPGNLELTTPGNATTGSPPWAAPRGLISICWKVGLEGTFSLWAGAVCWARVDLGVLSWSHLRTGCQQGNRIPEVLSLKREGPNFLNDCLRNFDCGMGRAGRILDPT